MVGKNLIIIYYLDHIKVYNILVFNHFNLKEKEEKSLTPNDGNKGKHKAKDLRRIMHYNSWKSYWF